MLKTVRAHGALQRLSQLALGVCVLSVAYLAFLPSADPPGASWDKANHLFAFAVMAWLVHLGWPAKWQATLRWGLLLSYGLAIEVVQHFLPLRHFSLLDWIADGIGILIYLGIKASWQRLYQMHLRQ